MSSGTLNVGEYHPSANSALQYVQMKLCNSDFFLKREAIAGMALSGNRQCIVCFETLMRIYNNESVSDRYLLGLVWFLKELDEVQPKREDE